MQQHMQQMIEALNVANKLFVVEPKIIHKEENRPTKENEILNQYTIKVHKLREALEEEQKADSAFELEKTISSWEKQIHDIRLLQSDLSINF
ncbi:hypothetical protein CVS40_11102 [Lucilia cuprina]|nr:hypothetical protein CVS40_11102 [Lucilia cuprina]